LLSLRINITRACNLDCEYCYIGRTNEFLDKTFIIKQVERYHPEKVTLTGGEPLLHPQVLDILQYLIQQRIHVNMVTNGTLLNRFGGRLGELAMQSESMGTSFSLGVSYDGNSKTAVGLLGSLIQLGIKRIKLYIYPFWKDLHKLREVLELAAKERVSVQLLYPVPIGSQQEYTNYDQWSEYIHQFATESNRLELEAYYQPNWAELCDINSVLSGLTDNVSIDSDGLIYECCLLTGLEEDLRLELNEKCQWRNNGGCLAITKNQGCDRRLEEHAASAICPVVICRV
jgi:MoaA/NifB/PqqE/SkfB family radical SAM enzyme